MSSHAIQNLEVKQQFNEKDQKDDKAAKVSVFWFVFVFVVNQTYMHTKYDALMCLHAFFALLFPYT